MAVSMKMSVYRMLHHVISQNLTNISKVLTSSIFREIALMMDAVSTSETSVKFYQTTWQNNSERWSSSNDLLFTVTLCD
jgi:sensor domain CHASE-containing protein